jgi:glycosyltransferase involved in cell wall biosynthesis
MAMGIPTVAFDTPVSREYLGDEGIYAKRGDPDALATALLEGLSDPSTDRRKGALRNLALEAYSWDSAAEAILQAYESVCQV